MKSRDSETRFGRQVRVERARRDWTQADLAQRMAGYGVSLHPSAIAKIEREGRAIRLDEAYAIACAFGMTVDQLLKGDV